MKFQLIIDEESEELITARVKKGNDLTAKIETLVKEYAGESKIVGFAEDETIILFIDEIHTLIGNKETSMDLANILKPAIDRGAIKLIGGNDYEKSFCYCVSDSINFLCFRLSFVASKLTFTRNRTKSSGASERSTEIQ